MSKAKSDLMESVNEIQSTEIKSVNLHKKTTKQKQDSLKELFQQENGRESLMDFIFSGKDSEMENPLNKLGNLSKG